MQTATADIRSEPGDHEETLAGKRDWDAIGISIALHTLILLALLYLRVPFTTPPDTSRPIAISFVQSPVSVASPNDSARPGAQAATNAPVVQTQPQRPAPPILTAPEAAAMIQPFTQTMQEPMRIIQPRPAPAQPAAAPAPVPQESPAPGLPGTSREGFGNDLGGSGGGNPAPGSGLGNGGGNAPAGGDPNENASGLHYLVLEIDGVQWQGNAMVGLRDFSDRLIQRCGLTAIHSDHQNWVVQFRLSFAADGRLLNVQPSRPYAATTPDYQVAAAKLMSALTNPACNHLVLPLSEQRRPHTGAIYLYPIGDTPSGIPRLGFSQPSAQ